MSEPFKLELGKVTHSFPLMTVSEYAQLQGRVAENLRKKNRDLLQEHSHLFGPTEQVKFLKDNDPTSIPFAAVEYFLSDDRRARSILVESLAKTGKSKEEAESIVQQITVVERNQLALHVAGLINLSPVPEEERLATARMKGLVRQKLGIEVRDDMTFREFYEYMTELFKPEEDGNWFEKNTKPGTAKQLITTAA